MADPRTRPEVPVLTFLGGVGTVTGSRFVVDTPTARVLVDCGMFQGLKELRARNRAPFGVDPASIDTVVLTHAHVDHSGYLPALVKAGFAGRVLTTAGTAALCDVLLPDSGHLQEEEAEYALRKGFSKHHRPEPLYTEEDGIASLERIDVVPFGETVRVTDGVQAFFRPAGHILGSATVTLQLDGGTPRSVLFSGDLGRPGHPLLQPPPPPIGADVILVESTYGGRTHDDTDALDRLASAVKRTVARGGSVVIPAFAVDRTEVVLFHLARMMRDGTIPSVPVYVDSPMALSALASYRRAIQVGSPEIRADLLGVGDPFDTGTLVEVKDVLESKAINDQHYPCIIVSASGMATGGRVLHHLARRLPDTRNTVVLVGYQAVGTRGRQLADGARQLKMLGHYVEVRAEIIDIPALSVHADHGEILDWLRSADRAPDTAYVVHGEPESSEALRSDIAGRLGWCAVAPTLGERVRLDAVC